MVILLVEDSEDDQLIFRRAVRKAGNRFTLEVFPNAQDALIYLSREGGRPPSLILVDLRLPGMGGVEFIGLCRGLLTDQGVMVVAMSSSSNPEVIESAISAGADTFMVKPTAYDDFVRAVNGLLEEAGRSSSRCD